MRPLYVAHCIRTAPPLTEPRPQGSDTTSAVGPHIRGSASLRPRLVFLVVPGSSRQYQSSRRRSLFRGMLKGSEGGHLTLNFNPEETKDLLKRGFSRRNFGRIATMLTAGATLPFYNEPALAQLS